MDLAHHVVDVHAKHQWTKLSLTIDAVAIIVGNSMMTREVQKLDTEEAMAIDPGVKIFQQFLGHVNFAIALIHCLHPCAWRNSTREQARLVASEIVDKKQLETPSDNCLCMAKKSSINHPLALH